MFTLPPDTYVRRVMGGRLKMYRQRRNLTQAQVAEQLGVGQSWLSKVESGRLDPSPAQLRGLALVLGIDPHVLLLL